MKASSAGEVFEALAEVLAERRHAAPESSYVAKLHAGGIDAILKKVGEEATETLLAAKGTDRSDVIHETADLWFHCMVMLSHLDIAPGEVMDELGRRFGTSGIVEKAARSGASGRGSSSKEVG